MQAERLQTQHGSLFQPHFLVTSFSTVLDLWTQDLPCLRYFDHHIRSIQTCPHSFASALNALNALNALQHRPLPDITNRRGGLDPPRKLGARTQHRTRGVQTDFSYRRSSSGFGHLASLLDLALLRLWYVERRHRALLFAHPTEISNIGRPCYHFVTCGNQLMQAEEAGCLASTTQWLLQEQQHGRPWLLAVAPEEQGVDPTTGKPRGGSVVPLTRASCSSGHFRGASCEYYHCGPGALQARPLPSALSRTPYVLWNA